MNGQGNELQIPTQAEVNKPWCLNTSWGVRTNSCRRISVCHLPGTNYATPLSLSLSSLRVGGLSALCWCVRAKCSPARGMDSVWGPTQMRSFKYAAQVHRKVHKSLTLCVEVRASSYTILIASDLRNVPNVLVGLFERTSITKDKSVDSSLTPSMKCFMTDCPHANWGSLMHTTWLEMEFKTLIKI